MHTFYEAIAKYSPMSARVDVALVYMYVQMQSRRYFHQNFLFFYVTGFLFVHPASGQSTIL